MRFVVKIPRLPCVLLSAAAHTIFLYALATTISLFDSFDAFDAPSAAEARLASAAVVFSGSFDRIDSGLQLLNSGVVPRLYISGLNANAGLRPSRFVAQFSVRNPNIPDLQRSVDCCVQWGEHADNTLENAVETRCWAQRSETRGPLLLITSRLHMARALTALSRELPDHRIIPFPAPEPARSTSRLQPRALEYLKYLGTLALTHVPSITLRLPILWSIASHCPQ